ncbi:MAG: prepilin-type N-terminal cleavage/methylation domain-containing protein [Verrucomicrobiota bacterium]
MFIKQSTSKQRGFTLIEMMVAVGIFSITGLALMCVYLFAMKSFAAMGNYANLSQSNRQAMDQLTSEIRQAKQVTAYSSNSITIATADANGNDLTVMYIFVPETKRMVRTASDGSQKTLLNDCDLITFNLFQRNPIGGSYDIYPAATGNWQQTVKVVQLSWRTSRTVLGSINSEDIQTARIVIRKQKNS